MPTPLRVYNITGADIDTTRSSEVNGWRFTFVDTAEAVTFGTIDDNENSFSAGDTSSALLPLLIQVTLVDDSPFAINNFDFITITYTDAADGTHSLDIWLPEETGTEAFNLYVDSDGNTWTDESLTTAAGGVITLSDTVSGGDAFGDYEHEIPLADTVSVGESFSTTILNLLLYLYDMVHADDSSISFSTYSLVLNLFDRVFVNDDGILFSVKDMVLNFYERILIGESLSVGSPQGWSQETAPSGTWTEE